MKVKATIAFSVEGDSGESMIDAIRDYDLKAALCEAIMSLPAKTLRFAMETEDPAELGSWIYTEYRRQEADRLFNEKYRTDFKGRATQEEE